MFSFKTACFSATLTTIAFILCGGKDCHAQTIGTGTVSYGTPTSGFVAAACDYYSASNGYSVRAVTYYATVVKGKYIRGQQCGGVTKMTPTYNNFKKYWDYYAAVPLDVRGGALYIVEIEVDYGDGSGFQTIEASPYIPR